MASAEIEEQERASSGALTRVFTQFAREIVRQPSGSEAANVEEAIRRTQAFQSALDTFEADALRYQQAGLPRMAGELTKYRETARNSEKSFRYKLSTILNPPSPNFNRAGDSGPRRCPINMLTEKMNAYRGLLAAGWPPAAAQAYVDCWYGL